MCFNRGVYKVSPQCQHHPFLHPPVHHPSIIPPTCLPPSLSPSLLPSSIPLICSSIHPPTFPPFMHASIRSSIHTLINPSTHPSVKPFISLPVHSPTVLKPRKPKRPEIKSSVLAHTVRAPELPSCSKGVSVLSCLSLVPFCVMGTVRVPAGLRASGRIVRGLEHCLSLLTRIIWALLVSTAVKRRKRRL